MSTQPVQQAGTLSWEPWEPAPGECLMPAPWEITLPIDHECDRVLERFPTLTEVGLHTREKHQRENEWRRQIGLPPIRHRPPVPITNPDQRRQIGLVRLALI